MTVHLVPAPHLNNHFGIIMVMCWFVVPACKHIGSLDLVQTPCVCLKTMTTPHKCLIMCPRMFRLYPLIDCNSFSSSNIFVVACLCMYLTILKGVLLLIFLKLRKGILWKKFLVEGNLGIVWFGFVNCVALLSLLLFII